MARVGINRETGEPLTGFAHLVQSAYVILSTKFGSRVMLRRGLSAVPGLLGRNIVPSTFLRFATALIVALELWEPCLRVVQITFPSSSNSPTLIRDGKVGIAILGQWLPNALDGDKTPSGPAQVLIL